MTQDGSTSADDRPSVADSPWLWIALFVCGALIALTLITSKFQQRQYQLERQYEARQAAGQSVRDEDASQATQSGQLVITLKPLFYFLVLVLLVLTIVFWSGRIRHYLYKKGSGTLGDQP